MSNKWIRVLVYTGLICPLVGTLLSLLHYKSAGITMMVIGLASLMIFSTVSVFLPNRRSAVLFRDNPRLRDMHRGASAFLHIGILITCIAVLLKLLHQPAYYMPFTMVGICLILFAAIVLVYLTSAAVKNMNQKPSVFIPEAELDQYIGVYANEQLKMDIKVFKKDGYLKGQATGQSSFTLSPVKEHVFNCQAAGIVMEFHPGANEFILIQNGGYYPFTKKVS